MATVLIMSANMAPLDLRYKGYGVMISIHDVINKILLYDLSYTVDVVR